jgi:hypothetical protein
MERGHSQARAFLGLPAEDNGPLWGFRDGAAKLVALLDGVTDARAQVITLTVVSSGRAAAAPRQPLSAGRTSRCFPPVLSCRSRVNCFHVGGFRGQVSMTRGGVGAARAVGPGLDGGWVRR